MFQTLLCPSSAKIKSKTVKSAKQLVSNESSLTAIQAVKLVYNQQMMRYFLLRPAFLHF